MSKIKSSTNKTDRHDIIEMLLKVVLNTINQSTKPSSIKYNFFSSIFYMYWYLNIFFLASTLIPQRCKGIKISSTSIHFGWLIGWFYGV